MSDLLERLNASLTPGEFATLLEGIYEHSPWVAEATWPKRPFASLAALKHALAQVVREAPPQAQLALIRAHPELAGKAMVARSLTAESANEQGTAGLTHCSAQEFETLQRLNAAYNEKFGFPFILAVRGPRSTGLTGWSTPRPSSAQSACARSTASPRSG
jgi:N-carbamoyl-L-amino-acid hydrolase